MDQGSDDELMTMSYFESGTPSPCMFAPDEWCDMFEHDSDTGPLDFFLGCLEAQTVGVIVPIQQEGKDAFPWKRVTKCITDVWQDRRIGFRCFPLQPIDWTDTKPCDACEVARGAQVVIIDLDGGNQRAACFREMARVSDEAIKHAQTMFQAPNKKLILTACGPVALPDDCRTIPIINYANDQGEPDFDLLSEGMSEIAQKLDLFHEGKPIHLEPDELGGSESKPWEAPVLADPEELSDEQLVQIIDPGEQDPLDQVGSEIARGEHSSALRTLVEMPGGVPDRQQERWLTQISACLDALSGRQLVEVCFSSGVHGVSIGAWDDSNTYSSSTLHLEQDSLGARIGRHIPLVVAERLSAEQLHTIYQRSASAKEPPPILVLVEAERPIELSGPMAEYAHATPPPQVMELHLNEVKQVLTARCDPKTLLRKRLQHTYDRAEDPFLQGINCVATGSELFGREELVRTLQAQLLAGHSLALMGPPRAGKTSVINRLAEVLADQDAVLARLDLRLHPCRTLIELYREISETVRRSLEDRFPSLNQRIARRRLFELCREPTASLPDLRKHFSNGLSGLLSSLSRDSDPPFHHLVLAVDDAEVFLPDLSRKVKVEYKEILLDLKRVIDQGLFRVLLVSSGGRMEERVREEFPLLDTLTLHHVNALSGDACREMIRSIGWRQYRYFSDDGLDAILRLGGRDPLTTKYLCSTILDTLGPSSSSVIDVEAVEKGRASFIASPGLLRKIQNKFDVFASWYPDEGQLLELICCHQPIGEMFDLARLKESDQLAQLQDMGYQLGTAVTVLQRHGWLERIGRRLRVQCELLHHELQRPRVSTSTREDGRALS